MINTIPLIMAVVGLGFALLYAMAESPFVRFLAKYFFFIMCIVAVYSAWIVEPTDSWLLNLGDGVVGITLFFLAIDIYATNTIGFLKEIFGR